MACGMCYGSDDLKVIFIFIFICEAEITWKRHGDIFGWIVETAETVGGFDNASQLLERLFREEDTMAKDLGARVRRRQRLDDKVQPRKAIS